MARPNYFPAQLSQLSLLCRSSIPLKNKAISIHFYTRLLALLYLHTANSIPCPVFLSTPLTDRHVMAPLTKTYIFYCRLGFLFLHTSHGPPLPTPPKKRLLRDWTIRPAAAVDQVIFPFALYCSYS